MVIVTKQEKTVEMTVKGNQMHFLLYNEQNSEQMGVDLISTYKIIFSLANIMVSGGLHFYFRLNLETDKKWLEYRRLRYNLCLQEGYNLIVGVRQIQK